MDSDLVQKCDALIQQLEMIPVKQPCSFPLTAVNGDSCSVFGLMNNKFITMDQVLLGDNVETRWTFQASDIHFFVFTGSLEIHFRLNKNLHNKILQSKQSLRIMSGIPFMLKTFEQKCGILLISPMEE